MIRLARILGITTQSVVLGALLFIAVLRILAIVADAVVFRYQGF